MSSILAVMVVYKHALTDLATIRSLVAAIPAALAVRRFKLVIYDNGPEAQPHREAWPFPSEYVHDATNPGVARAYNHAARIARDEGYEFLLLLDHDSAFGEEYLGRLADALDAHQGAEDIVAFAPRMYHGDRLFSPSRVLWGGIHRPIPEAHVGVYHGDIMAIGSCTVVRRSFIDALGGFNELFWLDCLDRWLFHMIRASGKQVYVLDVAVHHELSIFDFDRLMNEQRYRNQLKYETLFMRTYRTPAENLVFRLRLLKRALKLLVSASNPRYFGITLKHLLTLR